MELYGSNKIGNADMALGRNNPGALETILKERQNWANATTQEEKTAAHNRADNMRIAYGKYSGGADGMKGKYSREAEQGGGEQQRGCAFQQIQRSLQKPCAHMDTEI